MPVSTLQTSSPRFRCPSARWEPMNPPPPVMRTFILVSEFQALTKHRPFRPVFGEFAALDTIRSVARGDKSIFDQGPRAPPAGWGRPLPDHQLPPLQEGERPGEGIRHRPDEAVDPPGGLGPVDFPVLGPPSSPVGGLQIGRASCRE